MSDEKLVQKLTESMKQAKREMKQGTYGTTIGIPDCEDRFRQLKAGVDVKTMTDKQFGEFILASVKLLGQDIPPCPDVEAFGRAMRKAKAVVNAVEGLEPEN